MKTVNKRNNYSLEDQAEGLKKWDTWLSVFAVCALIVIGIYMAFKAVSEEAHRKFPQNNERLVK